NPQLLQSLLQGGAPGGELGQMLAQGAGALNALGAAFGIPNAASAVSPLASVLPLLPQLQEALGDDTVRSALQVALDARIPIGSVLRDIRSGALPADLLTRVMGGQAAPQDVVQLLRHLKQLAPGG